MIEYTKLKDKRVILRDAIPLKKPFTLLIEPSSQCNFRCKMCFQSAREQGRFADNKCNMTMECFSEVIRQAKEWEGDKFKVLKLCIYGEPFLNPNFCEMLKIAKEADIAERIETTTNASLFTEDICTNLVKYQLDYVRVSIYGGTQELHEEVTRSKVPLERIYSNLAMLKKIKGNNQKPFVAVKTLDSFNNETNQMFLDKFKDVADELYIDAPHNWVQPGEEGFMDKLYNEKIEQPKTGQYACPMPFTTLAVRSNGDIAPCCIDWYGGTTLGNIFSESISETWRGENLRNLQRLQLLNRKHENISCKNCELAENGNYTRDNIDGVSPEVLI